MKSTYDEVGQDYRQTIVLTQLEEKALYDGHDLQCAVLPQPTFASHVYHHEPEDWWVFGENTGRLRLRPIVIVGRGATIKPITPHLMIEKCDERWVWVIRAGETAVALAGNETEQEHPMSDRAKQLAALLKEAYLEITGADSSPTTLSAVAAVLAPWCERVERLEVERKPDPSANDWLRCRCGHVMRDHGDASPFACAIGCGCTAFRLAHDQETAVPAPEPTPGKTRGAEVAVKLIQGDEDGNMTVGYTMMKLPRTYVEPLKALEGTRITFAAVINREIAAARAQALDEAERAVREIIEVARLVGSPHILALSDAAAAVARVRGVPTKNPPL